MKKLICVILSAALIITPATAASAKQSNDNKGKQAVTQQENKKIKEQKQSFKLNGSPVIKYGRYKLPIRPVTKGMGAAVNFDKSTGVLIITKNDIKIVIDLNNKAVTVNGAADTTSGIFTAKTNKKMTVLLQYIAKILGVKVAVDNDDVTVIVPGLDFPTDVTVTPIGSNVLVNTLNSTTLFLNAQAKIKAGQATGGKAELYVGSKLIATDNEITATDTTVNFTTSDGTPVNSELQALVTTGGAITVKLYNTNNQSVISVKNNPVLTVDYVVPTMTGVTSALYSVTGGSLSVSILGGSASADKVDVTKLTLFDTTLAKSYQLTNAVNGGSTGTVLNDTTLLINLGAADKAGLAGFGTSTVYLSISTEPLLYDAAGNTCAGFTSGISIPVTVIK